MMFMIIAVIILALILYWLNKDYSLFALCKRIKTVNGDNLNLIHPTIPGKTIFGNNFDVLSFTTEELFQYFRNCVKYSEGKSYILMFIESAVLNITRAEDVERILSSQTILTKGVTYELLYSFIQTGLLTSTDDKWHFRRKLLTPAFHFNILASFLDIFTEESVKYLKFLDDNHGKFVSLSKSIPKFTLNNICETALGVKLDNLEDGDEYRKNINLAEEMHIKRTCNPFMYYEAFYRWFGEHYAYEEIIARVKEFSSNIIRKRRSQFKSVEENFDADGYPKKQRYAMLDTLLEAEKKNLIGHSGICEEVDTFMFEGYDTTSMCLIFALYNLSLYTSIQQKCYEEISQIDDITHLSLLDYNKLKYLECVIKETLRLYPSVPFIARQIVEDTIVDNLLLPKGTSINIHIFDINRDPRHFEDPEKFDPDRFLPENTINRNPFAYIPFSAGPRNCIGQKFAMLEMKVLLTHILKAYRILPGTKPNLKFQAGLILRTTSEVFVKFEPRTQAK